MSPDKIDHTSNTQSDDYEFDELERIEKEIIQEIRRKNWDRLIAELKPYIGLYTGRRDRPLFIKKYMLPRR